MASIERRGQKYRIVVSCGCDITGKQIKRTRTWTPEPNMTPRQIQKELQRQAVLFEEHCKKGGFASANVKFQILAEQWLQEYAEVLLKERTIQLFQTYASRVYNAIGHLKMEDITARQIQQFINALGKEGANKRTGGKLSQKTQKNILSFISGVFEYAMRMDMLTDNPTRRVRLPKNDTKEKDIYSLEEAQHFIDLLPTAPPDLHLFCMLAIFGGFRKGEILGFQWQDVDFDRRVIQVRRSVQYTKRKGTYIDTPKTKGSVRRVALPVEVMALLQSYHLEQLKQQRLLGDQWHQSDWIFTNSTGKLIGLSTLYKKLRRFCAANSIRYVSPHSFRHLYASLSIDAGVDIKAISSALGHSQTSTTINIYAHSLEKAQAKASQAVAEALLSTKK